MFDLMNCLVAESSFGPEIHVTATEGSISRFPWDSMTMNAVVFSCLHRDRPARRRRAMETRMEPRLQKFLEYVEAEIREQFSNELEECSHELELSREGAAMVLCWFGLAGLDEDVDGLIWRACGRLTSPRALQD
jgi:hypothetical protein